MATEHLDDWASEWTEGDSRILTLKRRVTSLESGMAIGNSSTSVLASSISKVDDHVQTILKNQAAMATHINLLHLCIAKKITPEEMSNLKGMLDSVDEENHVIAHETINNLFKQS